MPKIQSQVVLHHIRSLVEPRAPGTPTDVELLENYVARHDQAAFAALLRRHGPMVLAAGRRHTGHAADADDVFQATFLLLAQSARRIRKRASVGSWLHGVAMRLALRARKQQAQRINYERRAATMRTSDRPTLAARREMQELLDRALERLPDNYRTALVLCYLEGRTHEEIASQLDCPLGTVRSWVARGRALLRKDLAQRGLTLSAEAFVALAAANTASARVPAALAQATLTAAMRSTAAGGKAAAVSASVAELLGGGSMAISGVKWKLVLTLLLTLAIAGAGAVACPLLDSEPVGKKAPNASLSVAADGNQRHPAPASNGRTDAHGDPLPPGALLRLGETRFRPGARICNLAFSPDGKRLASWGNFLYLHDRLSLWDTATGKELRTELMEEGCLAEFAWCADGRGFAVLSPPHRRTIKDFLVWEFTNVRAKNPAPARSAVLIGDVVNLGQQIPEYYGPFGIAPNGQWLAAYHAGGGRQPEATLFKLAPAATVRNLQTVRIIKGLPPDARNLVFSQDNRFLFVFSHKNPGAPTETLTVFETARGHKVNTFTIPMALHQGNRSTFALSRDAARLALGLKDGTAQLINLKTGRLVRSVARHLNPGKDRRLDGVSTVAFSPDGQRLITGGRDNALKVWDVGSGREIFHLRGHHSWPEAAAFSPNGQWIASSGQDSLICMWNAATGKLRRAPQGHTHTVWGLAISPDGRHALTTGWDGAARLWDLHTGTEIHHFLEDANTQAVFLDDATILTHHQGKWQLWDRATGRPKPLPGGLAQGRGLAFGLAHDGRTLLTALDKTVTLWAWPSGQRLAQFQAAHRITKVMATTDGRSLLALQEGGFVAVWDRKTRQDLGHLPLRVGMYPDLTILTKEGVLVAAASHWRLPAQAISGNGILFCDVRTRSIVRQFPIPEKRIGVLYLMSLALPADGRTVAVGQSDGNAVLYEVATGQVRRMLRGHREAISSLAFTPDGRLVTTSLDHTGLVWDVSLRAGASVASGPIAKSEWPALWDQLGQVKAKPAFAALARLAGHPPSAIALLRQYFPPARGISDAALDQIIKDLDSNQFKVRRQAFRTLATYGETAVAGVKRRLAGAQSIELRRRLEAFLKQFDPAEPTAERLREIRAMQLLEDLATPEARDLLRGLAHGNANARRTQDAAEALKRCRWAKP